MTILGCTKGEEPTFVRMFMSFPQPLAVPQLFYSLHLIGRCRPTRQFSEAFALKEDYSNSHHVKDSKCRRIWLFLQVNALK